MKVDVLQVKDVEFSGFSWWSKWVDVAVFDFDHQGHLLQMKISRSNKKRFKVRTFSSGAFSWGVAAPKLYEVGDLTQMKRC